MPGKDPSEYDLDEVCIWLTAIGLGSKVEGFRENSVGGSMLVTLEPEDFAELGLSSLQGKKVVRSLEFTKDLANEGGGGGGDPALVAALEKENASLKDENAALRAQLREYAPAPAPPPPAPKAAPAPAPSAHRQPAGAPVVRGAAGGAARGAVLGAVAGAIAGDAGKGAKMGAAVGGTAGGMRGMGARRRARMRGY